MNTILKIAALLLSVGGAQWILSHVLPGGEPLALIGLIMGMRQKAAPIRMPPGTPGAPKALDISPISYLKTSTPSIANPTTVITNNADGSVVTKNPDGSTTTKAKDGTITSTAAPPPAVTNVGTNPLSAPTNYYSGKLGTTQNYAAPASGVSTFLQRLLGSSRAPVASNPLVSGYQQAKENYFNKIFSS
jgi:hypothetical protein